MYQLRPYQQDAVRAVVCHFRQSSGPAVVVLPTGAGKSLVIAELARLARGRVLVLAHVKELVEQNFAKFTACGGQASLFSAGLQRKETQFPVVFGSVQSVARNLAAFAGGYSLLVIDECHRVDQEESTQYQQVISALRAGNPDLRILGLTATPYRLGSGWIYHRHYRGMVRGDAAAFFQDCIYELPLRLMIRQGYLTPPRLVDAPVALYDFSALTPGSFGTYSQAELDQVVAASGRVTAGICLQLQRLAESRQGVMVFAATVEHAREVVGYLPSGSAALILGETPARERDALIAAFKARQLKYLVNVAVLTTGFDAPHVDLIALLRPTESVSLFQQIIGRGLRLSPGKAECLIVDYAGNGFDLYAPEVGEPRPASDAQPVCIHCPECGFGNTFWGRLDGDGAVIEHYGRRCQGLIETAGHREQCDFRYRFKLCDGCGAQNDIAARRCGQCQRVLVDPDARLKDALALKDARVLRVAAMQFFRVAGRSGAQRLRITYTDEEGSELSESFGFATPAQRAAFVQQFARVHQRSARPSFVPRSVEEALHAQPLYRVPDFVIGRKAGRYWQIRDKIFDYEGRYRRAHELR